MRRNSWRPLASVAAVGFFLAVPAEAAQASLHAWGGGSGEAAVVAEGATQDGASRRLRLCNAYAFDQGMTIYHRPQHEVSAVTPNWQTETAEGEEELTASSGPLQYKSCRDFDDVRNFGPGSTLSYTLTGGMQVAAFSVGGHLPPPGSLLQVVIYRHDTETPAADFISHAFPASPDGWSDPEIAVVDTYHTTANRAPVAPLQLHERGAFARTVKHTENVDWNTAVTVRPGTYEWLLMSKPHKIQMYTGYAPVPQAELEVKESCQIWMRSGQYYTVMRVGIDAFKGPTFPEEVIAFPSTWAVCGLATRPHRLSAMAATVAALAWALTALAPPIVTGGW